jgi:hypothetical protein
MNLIRRFTDLIRMFFASFVEGAEGSVPLERRLAYDRAKRAANVKQQIEAAEDVGAAAELMVTQLAEARIMAANLRSEAKAHLEAAAGAASRGDEVTRTQEEDRAAALAEELAEAEAEIATLEELAEDALSDKKEAIGMVLEQSRELEKLSRGDSRLVAKVRMTEMRRQQLALREQMMDLVPGDQDNVRARIQEQAERDEAKYRARRDVVDALWEQKKGTSKQRTLSTSAAGRAKLEELKAEVGYVTAPPAAVPAAVPSATEAPPAVAAAPEPTEPAREAAAGADEPDES